MEIRGLIIVLTWDVIILNIGLVYYHASKPVGVGYLSYTILEKNLEVFILNPNSGVVSCGLVIRSCWINIDEISSRESNMFVHLIVDVVQILLENLAYYV